MMGNRRQEPGGGEGWDMVGEGGQRASRRGDGLEGKLSGRCAGARDALGLVTRWSS